MEMTISSFCDYATWLSTSATPMQQLFNALQKGFLFKKNASTLVEYL
jgi:hypothetical protein